MKTREMCPVYSVEKSFTVVIGKDVRSINNKVYYLTEEDKKNTVDIFNKFLEDTIHSENQNVNNDNLHYMAREILNNEKRNKECDKNEKLIQYLINKILGNVSVNESFTYHSINSLTCCSMPLFVTATKRLIENGILTVERMAINYTKSYTNVYTRIE